MDKYDEMYKVKKVIEEYNGYYSAYQGRPKNWRSTNTQWDKIICTVCIGCGKPLGRYENLKRLAFCHECREILFPETVSKQEYFEKRFPYSRSRGHFL